MNDGTWFERTHWVGKFHQKFDMKHFPFDQHLVTFRLTLNCSAQSGKFDVHEIEICTNSNQLNEEEDERMNSTSSSSMSSAPAVIPRAFASNKPIEIDIGGADFNVQDPYFKVRKRRKKGTHIVGKGGYDHILLLTVPITRKWKNYMWQIFYPLTVIEIAAFCAYAIEEAPTYFRMAYLGLLMSTILAFKFTVADTIPNVPYLTYVDYHFNYAFLFLLMHCILAGVTVRFIRDKEWYGTKVDLAVFCTAMTIFLTIKGFLVCKGIKYIRDMEYDYDPLRNIKVSRLLKKSNTVYHFSSSVNNVKNPFRRSDTVDINDIPNEE